MIFGCQALQNVSLMEVLSSDYKIDTIVPYTDTVLDPMKSYLWIWHADKIPPHIGISTTDAYFSLKSSGKDVALPVSSIIALIERKQIKTLNVELKDKIDIDFLQSIFNRYKTAVEKRFTCLTPIKEILNRPLPTRLDYLLTELDSDNQIERYIGFNIDESFEGIPFYTEEDIHHRLALLAQND
mgnify:CR=1 FL=1